MVKRTYEWALSAIVLSGSMILSAHAASVPESGQSGPPEVRLSPRTEEDAVAPLIASESSHTPGAGPSVQPAERGLVASLTFRGTHTFDADQREGSTSTNASVSVTRASGNLSLSAPITESWRWTVDFSAEGSWYNWANVGGLVPGAGGRQPIGDALDITILPGLAYNLDDEWTIVAGGIVEFAGEPEAELGSSTTYGGYAGAQYRVSKNLSLTFGARVQTRLRRSTSFFPLIGARWQINDKVTLASEGPGGRVSVKLDPDWSISLFGRYERREFRLADDGAIEEGIVRDTRIPIGIALSWQIGESLRASIEGGAIVYQEFTFDDRAGQRLGRSRTAPAPFVGLSAQLTF